MGTVRWAHARSGIRTPANMTRGPRSSAARAADPASGPGQGQAAECGGRYRALPW
jgi:hypothetical protein